MPGCSFVTFLNFSKRFLALLIITSCFTVVAQLPAQQNAERLNVKGINRRVYVDQMCGTSADFTVCFNNAAALLPASGGVLDASGFTGSTTARSTISWPTKSGVVLIVACGFTLNGPASGNIFNFNSVSNAGGGIIGLCPTSAGNSPNTSTVFRIKANAANASDMVNLGFPNTTGMLNGITLQHIQFDANGSGANAITLQSVHHSTFDDLDFENCNIALNAIETGTTGNLGNQFNRFTHIRGKGCAQALKATDNNQAQPNTSDFTQNWLTDWSLDMTCNGSNPLIELDGADTNWMLGIKIFRTSGTCYTWQFTPPAGNHIGAPNNFIWGIHGNNSNFVNVPSGFSSVQNNVIYGYDTTDGEPAPNMPSGLGVMWYPTPGYPGGAGPSYMAGPVFPNGVGLGGESSTGVPQTIGPEVDSGGNVAEYSKNGVFNFYSHQPDGTQSDLLQFTSGKVTLYQGISTAGQGLSPVLGAISKTGLSVDLAPVTVYAASADGKKGGPGAYRICVNAYTTKAGTGTTTQVNLFYNNGAPIKVVLIPMLNLASTGTPVATCQLVHVAANTSVTVSTASGVYGTSVYAIDATAEQLK